MARILFGARSTTVRWINRSPVAMSTAPTDILCRRPASSPCRRFVQRGGAAYLGQQYSELNTVVVAIDPGPNVNRSPCRQFFLLGGDGVEHATDHGGIVTDAEADEDRGAFFGRHEVSVLLDKVPGEVVFAHSHAGHT